MNFSVVVGALLTILLLPLTAYADSSGPSLTARPGLCILRSPEAEQCIMPIRLDWQADELEDICLHSSQITAPLRCWQRESSGFATLEITASDNVSFWLQRSNTAERLAQLTVRIVRMARQSPERRRRRHVWSVL